MVGPLASMAGKRIVVVTSKVVVVTAKLALSNLPALASHKGTCGVLYGACAVLVQQIVLCPMESHMQCAALHRVEIPQYRTEDWLGIWNGRAL